MNSMFVLIYDRDSIGKCVMKSE